MAEHRVMGRPTLTHVNDEMPGWRRVRHGQGFRYCNDQGKPIREQTDLDRIQKLGIPPAYEDVWICPNPRGHLQATGRDARGRKQYRYHPEWVAQRKNAKFLHLAAFGAALTSIRDAVAHDLAATRLSCDKVAALVVSLLDRTGMRVGNDAYAQDNGTHGLTTLLDRHVQTHADQLLLRFKGKSGVMQQVRLQDKRLLRIIRRCQELPGQRLFQFLDDQGDVQHLRSDHVNTYLQATCQHPFTAKDFRTWHANVCALELALRGLREPSDPPLPKSAPLLDAQSVKCVAQELGHTSTVCRNHYLHPQLLVLNSTQLSRLMHKATRRLGLSPVESALQRLLETP